MNIIIIGASHGIGKELAYQYGNLGHELQLFARDLKALKEIKSDIGDNVKTAKLDVCKTQEVHEKLEKISNIDLFIYCAGAYTPNNSWESNLEEAKKINEVNFIGALNALDVITKKMVKRKSGHIALVSSVAGYVGLPQSYAYGASKAALINLAETLHAELSLFDVKVSIINPGFVKTRLTDKNNFKMPAIISASSAAAYIIKDLKKGKFEIHFPKKFTIWLKLLKILPYRILFFFHQKNC